MCNLRSKIMHETASLLIIIYHTKFILNEEKHEKEEIMVKIWLKFYYYCPILF